MAMQLVMGGLKSIQRPFLIFLLSCANTSGYVSECKSIEDD